MTRRQISRKAFDADHKGLLLKVRSAPRGQLARWQKRLKDHVTALLKAST